MNVFASPGLLLLRRVPRRVHRVEGRRGPVPRAHRLARRPEDAVARGHQGRALLARGLAAAGLLRRRLQRQIRLRQTR